MMSKTNQNQTNLLDYIYICSEIILCETIEAVCLNDNKYMPSQYTHTQLNSASTHTAERLRRYGFKTFRQILCERELNEMILLKARRQAIIYIYMCMIGR